MKVTDMDLEVPACPAIWGCKVDGKPAYIRYRWGYLSLKLDEGKGFANSEIIGEQIGDSFDGMIEEQKVIDWLKYYQIEVE